MIKKLRTIYLIMFIYIISFGCETKYNENSISKPEKINYEKFVYEPKKVNYINQLYLGEPIKLSIIVPLGDSCIQFQNIEDKIDGKNISLKINMIKYINRKCEDHKQFINEEYIFKPKEIGDYKIYLSGQEMFINVKEFKREIKENLNQTIKDYSDEEIKILLDKGKKILNFNGKDHFLKASPNSNTRLQEKRYPSSPDTSTYSFYTDVFIHNSGKETLDTPKIKKIYLISDKNKVLTEDNIKQEKNNSKITISSCCFYADKVTFLVEFIMENGDNLFLKSEEIPVQNII